MQRREATAGAIIFQFYAASTCKTASCRCWQVGRGVVWGKWLPREKTRQQKDRAVWYRDGEKYLKFSPRSFIKFSTCWKWAREREGTMWSRLRRVATRMQLFHSNPPSGTHRISMPSLQCDELLSFTFCATLDLLSLKSSTSRVTSWDISAIISRGLILRIIVNSFCIWDKRDEWKPNAKNPRC